jgi:drug/metabolite transporter (DMT)-like permease
MSAAGAGLGTAERPGAPARGIACMVLSGALLTCNDAAMKSVSKAMPLGEILFLRGGLAFLLLLGFALLTGQLRALKVTQYRAQTARAGLMIAGTFLFIGGIRQMPLADAIAVAFIGPILVTAMAPALLGEYVGWRRWLAVLTGFAGVLLMLRPSADAFYWVALLPLGAACTGALRDIITRRLAYRDTTLATLAVTTGGVALGGLVTLPLGWTLPPAGDLGLLLLAATLLCTAHYLMIEAFRLSQAAVVVPFKYVSLIWATLLGFLVWGDVPQTATLVGAGLVVLAGLYILHRERRLART